ncbi:MAG: ABC transporter ATP-binding protein [Acidimicrobiales bacterium]|nr:ABC transporter ATP-binding protein [Acidimicrobiales bacterium]
MVTTSVAEGHAITKTYGQRTVLSSVDFTVGTGVTGLVGSNGAGKTTLMSLLLGLRPRNGGNLSVLGVDPATAGPEVRQRLGYAPEHHHLPPDVSAADLVRHLALLHGLPRRAATERANDTLWLVGLGEERFRPIGTMSTGQRQRVKLAGAIAHSPAMALLDEPTDGLDPVQRDDMLALVRRIGAEFDIAVLLSSHQLHEVERICDAVIVLDGGRVVRSGALADLQLSTGALLVEVDDRGEDLARMLVERGCTVEPSGPGRLLVTGPDEAADIIRDAVVELHVGLRRLEARRTSLDDLFLDTAP